MTDEKIAGARSAAGQEPAGGDAPPPQGGDTPDQQPAEDRHGAGPVTRQQTLPLDQGVAPQTTRAPQETPEAQTGPQTPQEPPDAPVASLEAELEEMRRVRDDLERQKAELGGVLQRERDSGRLRLLREMGAIGEVPDQVLLQSAPDVDIHTAEGRVALDQWRQTVPTMFRGEPTPVVSPATIAQGLPVSRHGFWSRDKAEDFIRRNS